MKKRQSTLYVDDCLKVIGKKVKAVDYVFTVPPDFAELKLDPKKEAKKYYEFIDRVLEGLTGITTCITILMTDRKHGGVIVPKHKHIIDFFESKKWYLKTHKIWVKSKKVNLFRLNYSNIMTFSKTKTLKNKNTARLDEDCFDYRNDFKQFKYGMPVSIAERYICACCNQDQTVFDPFTGSGTTMLAAINKHRFFVGSEIDQKSAKMAVNRLLTLQSKIYISDIVKDHVLKLKG